jgi:short-subunit dehydrogenase
MPWNPDTRFAHWNRNCMAGRIPRTETPSMSHPRFHTLITGATSGIGLHLAHQFAAGGHPLTLVAPVKAELEEVARLLREQHGGVCDFVACDLERDDALLRIAEHLGERELDVLVNNAGHGQLGRFWEIPLERHLAIVRLNIEAVLRLTAHFLPAMVRRNRGGLLNLASIAGFEPGPKLAVYHASKAFVLSWSEALATALCPGPTDTDFFDKADMENTRAFQQANLMSPQDVAKIGYEGFLAGERVVVAGAVNKVMVATRRILPESLQAAKNEKFYEDVPPDQRTRKRGDKELDADERGAA